MFNKCLYGYKMGKMLPDIPFLFTFEGSLQIVSVHDPGCLWRLCQMIAFWVTESGFKTFKGLRYTCFLVSAKRLRWIHSLVFVYYFFAPNLVGNPDFPFQACLHDKWATSESQEHARLPLPTLGLHLFIQRVVIINFK